MKCMIWSRDVCWGLDLFDSAIPGNFEARMQLKRLDNGQHAP